MVCDENASKWNAPRWNRAKVGHVKLGHIKLARAKLNAPNWHDIVWGGWGWGGWGWGGWGGGGGGGGCGGGGGLALRNMLRWPWVTLAETPALSRPAAWGGGGGIRHVARLSEGGHLTREAACCELHRLVHCSTTVLNHGLCRKLPLLSLGRGWGGGGGGGEGGGGGRGGGILPPIAVIPSLVLLLYSCRIISRKGWGWEVGGGGGGGGGGLGVGEGVGGGGGAGVGVERWAVRGREGGVHKGAPSNTQQH